MLPTKTYEFGTEPDAAFICPNLTSLSDNWLVLLTLQGISEQELKSEVMQSESGLLVCVCVCVWH